MTDEQLAFDIEAMLHEAAVESAPDWVGSPLGFTTAFWPAAELDAAHEHWQFGAAARTGDRLGHAA